MELGINQRFPNDRKGTVVRDDFQLISEQYVQDIEMFFESELFLTASLAIKEMVLSDALTDGQHWAPVSKLLFLNDDAWRISTFKYVTAVDVDGKQAPVTFARLSPSAKIKEKLRSESRATRNDIAGLYSAALMSATAAEARVDLIGRMNCELWKGQDYDFIPVQHFYGLLPSWDFDAVLPFLSRRWLATQHGLSAEAVYGVRSTQTAD